MKSKEVFDVTVIGGGPAGLFSAFYSGCREMKIKLIEYHSFLGGKLNVYPEKMVWDVGGVVPSPAHQLVEHLVGQAKTFQPEIVLDTKVTSISKGEDGIFTVHTQTGKEHYSKTIILAIGGGILKPTRLEIDGAERFEVTNLHYTVKSLTQFKEKRVLISGGGNAAIDWANELESIADQVYLTYRKDSLKGHESEVSKLQNSTVHCLLNTTIEKLVASSDHVTIRQVILRDEDQEENIYVDVDEVIINHGFERERELIENSPIPIEMASDITVAGNAMGETSVEGLFAAGDILEHDGKLRLIAGAFTDAATAVNRAKLYIAPDASSRGIVSTHNDLFKEKNREVLKRMQYSE
ncbi:thioredoxin reductase [Sporosarcina sp. P13]|uniref:NAD(P)/FAD-dependent oxidoreductase n=1 Tax=Sporosarcina sp. P13 TaxID=2048263 RepID=UPI000C171457|nr:NAD(P)/FAD-dependent oxidoreductase [Sporosarcina sp. P13]PIC64657.1 thioredoxin reductase [Sporosarcina sp. P13]